MAGALVLMPGVLYVMRLLAAGKGRPHTSHLWRGTELSINSVADPCLSATLLLLHQP